MSNKPFANERPTFFNEIYDTKNKLFAFNFHNSLSLLLIESTAWIL